MGFGSSGGGFSPSPNNVPGSTQTGTDQTDSHQFTGSVQITGSLLLNGSSITGGGGGGGAVATYTNAGDNRVITSVNADTINGEASLTFDGTSLTSPQVTASVSMKTPALEISSSANGALFRVDHANQSGPEPILFVSSSGIIGIGTDNPAPTDPAAGDDTNRLHIVGNNGAEQGQTPVVNTQLVLENDNHAGLQFIFPSGQAGQITWGIPGALSNNRKAVFYYSSANNRYEFNGPSFGGARVMTMLASGDSVNIGKSGSPHMVTDKACLHISSSTGGTDDGGPVLLRVDHADQPNAAPILFVTGSGQVGIGTSSPGATLEVSGTFLMPGDKPIQLRDSTSNINSPFAGIMQLSASLTQITNDVMLSSPNVPGTAGASGQPGQIAWDADYFYVCVGVNSWKRVAIAAW
jgi:hypothetical protein